MILLNGFTKKSQKTPKNEIEKALRLMNDYFNEKKGGQNEHKNLDGHKGFCLW